MIYSHDYEPIKYILDLHTEVCVRSYACTERPEAALTLSRESITHSAAYFRGSKDHTPLCACVLGHVLKMYQLTNTSLRYIRKTNGDLQSPKEHFRHLHQKYPERHRNIIGYFCNQMKYLLYPRNETSDKNRYITTP